MAEHLIPPESVAINVVRLTLAGQSDPEDPATNYVKRLVGLPGEEVMIRDGGVWIDGAKQTPPEPYTGLHYIHEFGEYGEHWNWVVMWGSPQRPAKLGADEFFVLGDFSPRARDSHLWEEGAPGHPPYAVPRSHRIGVVTTIYWPPSRWRAFR